MKYLDFKITREQSYQVQCDPLHHLQKKIYYGYITTHQLVHKFEVLQQLIVICIYHSKCPFTCQQMVLWFYSGSNCSEGEIIQISGREPLQGVPRRGLRHSLQYEVPCPKREVFR